MYLDLVFFSDEKILAKFEKKFSQRYVFAKHFSSLKEIESFKSKYPSVKVCQVIEKPDSKEVSKYRQKADFLAVNGKNIERNSFAVSKEAVDFLLMPCCERKPEFDTAIARIASKNRVGIAVLFSEFLNAEKKKRSMMFKNYFFVAKLCKKFKARILFFSGALNERELRKAKDFSSFGILLGLSLNDSLNSVRKAEEFLKKRRFLEGYKIIA